MKLQRREGASASSDRISAARRPVGLLEGRQTRSSVEFRASSPQASEKHQHWLSCSLRSSVSSLPGATQPTHRRNPQRTHDNTRLGRQNKASLLRMKTCPTAYAEPNYTEMAQKKKNFVRRCKIISTSTAFPMVLPEGETLHGFLTGARYNSAHHVDSRSLARLGVYVPRRDASKSFINLAGTVPPSPAIYGLKRYPKGGRQLSESHGMLYAPPRRALSDVGFYHSLRNNPVSATSTASVDWEIEELFGPDQGSTGSEASSLIGQCDGEPVSSRSDIQVPHVVEEKAMPSGQLKVLQDTKIFALRDTNPRSSQVLDSREGDNTDLSPVAAVSKAGATITEKASAGKHLRESDFSRNSKELPTLKERETNRHGSSSPPCEAASVSQVDHSETASVVSKTSGDIEDQHLDLLSPEAQRLTDEILRECQNSSSSFGSSESSTQVSQEGPTDTSRSPPECHETECTLANTDTQTGDPDEPGREWRPASVTELRPGSASSRKSSSIVVHIAALHNHSDDENNTHC